MDIKQEPNDFIEDQNLESVFIKQAKEDNPPTEYLQESHGMNKIIDGADENYDLLKTNTTKKGLSLNGRSMKKKNPRGRIFLCIVCGYMSIKGIELLSHSSIHFFNKKNLFKTKINRKYKNKIRGPVTHTGMSIDADVKAEIVDYELKELNELEVQANLFKDTDDLKLCSNETGVSNCMCYCSKSDNNPVKCEICSKYSQQRQSVNGLCQIDGKSLDSECCFNEHLCTHLGEKPDIIYSTSFAQKGHLNINLRTHTGKKPFQCNDCAKYFSNKSNLKRHLRTRTQAGEKLFKCNVCKKSFSQEASLKCHMRTHTGEKPFKCNVCLKSFAYGNSLKYHLHTHTAEKPFKCNVCMKSFSERGKLKRHLYIHSDEKPLKCNICTKSFSEGIELKIHSRIHTGEKPFKCNVCPKSFSKKKIISPVIYSLTLAKNRSNVIFVQNLFQKKII